MDSNTDGLTLDGTRFRVGFGPGTTAGPAELLLMKPRWMVERYVKLIEALRPRRIVELGIYRGGSVAFLALLANPDKYVATGLRAESSRQFDDWLQSHDEVRPYYGIDQADTSALRGILAAEFVGEPLDLVIDDASHLLEPTRSSFNVLFPLLRAGGMYVIEDWSHDHGWERLIANDAAIANRIREEAATVPEPAERLPLTRLLFEIVLASAYTDLIESMESRANWFVVTRGIEQTSVEDFDIRALRVGVGTGSSERCLPRARESVHVVEGLLERGDRDATAIRQFTSPPARSGIGPCVEGLLEWLTPHSRSHRASRTIGESSFVPKTSHVDDSSAWSDAVLPHKRHAYS